MGTGGSSADLTTVNNNTNKLVTRADTMVSSLSQIEIKTNAAQTYLGYINLKIDDVKSSVVSMANQFTLEKVNGEATMRHYLKNLSDVLANDDDVALRESQKENSKQVEKDFLSGASAGTSLGKSDFGSLSSVGSLAKDIVSLNGRSSVVSFIVGLNNAEYQGQGWFSEATRSALDAVSPSSTRSFRSVRATPVSDADPYNFDDYHHDRKNSNHTEQREKRRGKLTEDKKHRIQKGKNGISHSARHPQTANYNVQKIHAYCKGQHRKQE